MHLAALQDLSLLHHVLIDEKLKKLEKLYS